MTGWLDCEHSLRSSCQTVANLAIEMGADAHIAKIIKTYQYREQEARYSRRLGMAEIDLDATHGELVEIENDIEKAKQKHNGFLKELGLKLLP